MSVLPPVHLLFRSQWRNLIKERPLFPGDSQNETAHCTDLYCWTVFWHQVLGIRASVGWIIAASLSWICLIPSVLCNKNKNIFQKFVVRALGAFVKFRKAAINFGMSVRHVDTHWTDFREVWYLKYFSKKKIYRENSNLIKILQE